MLTVTFDHLRGLPVLRRFYQLARNLFGVSIVMLSPDGRTSLGLGGDRWSPGPFCRALHRQVGKDLCERCDQLHLGRCLSGRRPLRYRCFAGLTEFLIPMTLDDEIVAFLQCGQVLDAPASQASWQAVRRRLRGAGVEAGPLRDGYMKTRVIRRAAQADLIALLELIGDYVMRTQRDLLLTEGSRSSQIVSRARRHMRRHLAEHISLDAVAHAAYTSKRNLCRVFRAETGRTVLAHLHAQRIALACDRLRRTDDPCAAVAFACGFGSIQQFNRVFREHMRMTPTQWRAAPAPPR